MTVQILDDTPAVLSLGKLCEEHRYSYEWACGQRATSDQDWKIILCNTENVVLVVVPGWSPSSGASSTSTSLPQDSSSISPSPARLRREDTCHQATRDRLRDLPDWLEEFTDNLEDAEVPAPAHTYHDSDSERPSNVALRKHSIYSHFPKDQNCEICKRTKITRAPCRKRTGEAVPRAEKSMT